MVGIGSHKYRAHFSHVTYETILTTRTSRSERTSLKVIMSDKVGTSLGQNMDY